MQNTNHASDPRRLGPRRIPLQDLRVHPLNSNVMPADLREKLKAHIHRTGRYTVVVRPHPAESGAYEILDGHHRVEVPRELGHAETRCDVWNVDDRETQLLLATLLADEAEKLEKVLPKVMTFVVTPEQEKLIDRAVELASDGTQGRDRKTRGLA